MEPEARILFLYGNDEYAIARRAGELSSVFTDRSEAEMNTARLDARTMTQDEWINAVGSMPFLAKQRLVLLSNPSGRFAQRRSKTQQGGDPHEAGAPASAPDVTKEGAKEARERFLRSLESIPDTTRVVITETIELRTKQDRMAAEKHWLATWLKKRQQGVELLEQPGAGMMPGWIAREAKQQGGDIAGAAAVRLAAMVGTDTRQATQEITKLLTFVSWSRPVTVSDVEALSPLTAPPDVFKFVDALAQGNRREAQRALHHLLELEDAFALWGMVIREFRHLLVAREVLDHGGGENEAVRALSDVEGRGVHSFVAAKALKNARGFTMTRLELIYRQLLEIDEAAKTGRMPLDVALDLLVVEQEGSRSG